MRTRHFKFVIFPKRCFPAPTPAFKDVSLFRHLYVQNNDLESIDKEAFANLALLESLTLTDNKISSLPGYIFSNMSSLQRLYLQNNEITSLEDNTFEGLYNVCILILCTYDDYKDRNFIDQYTQSDGFAITSPDYQGLL